MTMNQTPNAQVLVRQAASLLQQGFSKKAQQAINLAFQQGATSGVAWDIYAQACANLNQLQPAILGLKKAISLTEGGSTAPFYWGKCWSGLDNGRTLQTFISR